MVLVRLMQLDRSFSYGKHLLRRHSAPLCPCRDKGLLPEMVADSSHCMVIVSPFNRLQGRTDSFAQRFGSSPKLSCPGRFSLPYYHTSQSSTPEAINSLSP